MLAIFLQTLSITAPVFAMLFLGVLLKRINWIDDHFIHVASSLVFNVMPVELWSDPFATGVDRSATDVKAPRPWAACAWACRTCWRARRLLQCAPCPHPAPRGHGPRLQPPAP